VSASQAALRNLNKGEILGLLHALAVMAKADDHFDPIDEYTAIKFPSFKIGQKPPTFALKDLSLPESYPWSTMFVTTWSFICLPYVSFSI
jgi:hypothetical protein